MENKSFVKMLTGIMLGVIAAVIMFPIIALIQDAAYNAGTAALIDRLEGRGYSAFTASAGDTTFTGDLVPDAVNSYDFGLTTAEWRDIYLGDSGNILFGNAQDVDLGRSAANTLTLATGDTLAITSAASLTVAGNAVVDVGGATMSGSLNMGGNDLTVVNTLTGSNNTASLTVKGDLDQSTQRDIVFATSNAADALGTTRLTIGSGAAEPTATWASIVHSGFKLGSAMDANNQNITSVGIANPSPGGLWVGRATDPTGGAVKSIALDAGNSASSDAELWLAGSRTVDGATATISFANWGNTGAATTIAQIRGRYDVAPDPGGQRDTGKIEFAVKKDGDASLNSAMTIDSNGGVSFPAFALSIPDNANGGTAAEYTFTPTTDAARLVEVTCLDAQGCNVTMGETSVKNGQVVTFVNVAANVVNFADSAGISELAAAFAAGVNDVLHVYYSTSLTTWIETGRSDN